MKIQPNPAYVSAATEALKKMMAVLNESMASSNRIQRTFLEQQAQNLRTIAASLGLAGLANPANPAGRAALFDSEPRALFTRPQLDEFGSGSITKCFGSDFAILDTRKTPRIPNGDLLMIDRVLSIDGERGKLQPPVSITSEFDVSADAWFLHENPYPGVPLGILMEIALQPCGILSAYLGSSLLLPADVNTFRNLDGAIHFFECPPLSGKTITQKAHLLNSIFSSGMLIQKFSFELSLDSRVFLTGESSFGYFRESAMQRQTGLEDAPETTISANPKEFIPLDIPRTPTVSPSPRHLDLIDDLTFQAGSGKYGQGLISGSRRLDGSEWFYRNHFHQDPVMPGSLGVEAITQALWVYLQHFQPVAVLSVVQLDFSNPSAMQWKYRGQVIPSNRRLQFKAHIKNGTASESHRHVQADGEFWVEGRKIYTIENISLILKEG